MVAAILGLLLLLVNSGRNLSVDGWIVRRFPRLRVPLLYYGSPPTSGCITAAKWLALFSYWLVCLYSLSMHLNEPAWRTGTAGPLLLTNNFMSRPYEAMGDLFTGNHWAVFLARLAMWSMLPWYALLVPCVLISSIKVIGPIARFYAIAWGVLFFLLSFTVLQLGWLAEIELLLWAAVFWSRAGITTPQRFSAVFDDRSKLCDRTVQFVRVVDVFDRVKLVSASENLELLQSHGISCEQATETRMVSRKLPVAWSRVTTSTSGYRATWFCFGRLTLFCSWANGRASDPSLIAGSLGVDTYYSVTVWSRLENGRRVHWRLPAMTLRS